MKLDFRRKAAIVWGGACAALAGSISVLRGAPTERIYGVAGLFLGVFVGIGLLLFRIKSESSD